MKYEQELTGGHHNSLGNTLKVVEDALKNRANLEQLYQCYFSDDEVVRLRVSNAMKRVCREQPDWVLEYLDNLLDEISEIDQPSAKWTLSQLFMLLDRDMTDSQRKKAVAIVKHNLDTEPDWIVQNFGMEYMFKMTKYDQSLKKWLKPRLQKNAKDKERESVARRAEKFLAGL
ncbi:MAG: hypothetical protein AAF413_04560 [Patescibacteria group bacterium]